MPVGRKTVYSRAMRISFKTFGCRLNQAESERFSAVFSTAGWQIVSFATPSDVVVIHGCAVTHTAELKCLQLARNIKQGARQAGQPEPWVVLVGCVVEAGGSSREVAGVDLLVARQDQERLLELVADRFGAPLVNPAAQSPLESPPRRKRALLKVQDGCDFFCTYCIVPHTRGAPVSRPWQVVLDEARALAQSGFSELVIAGCNVACYRDGGRNLADLLSAIAALDEVQRIRLSSIEPSTSEGEVIECMAVCHKLCRYLHLPLQSGDAGVLRSMGRTYTPEAFAATVRQAVRLIPDLGLGTDLITGFPGETREAFERTRQLVSELPFNNLHVFPYSERPGTPAIDFSGKVPPGERRERARLLQQLHVAKRLEFARRFVGRPVQVLVEGIGRDGRGHGWSGEYLECRMAGVGRTSIGSLITCTPIGVDEGAVLV